MYAIIETGGKQYKVSPGETVAVEKLAAETGGDVVFDKVLAVIGESGDVVGNPYIQGGSVKAEVVAVGKAPKVLVFKQKPRKGHRKLRGHRQPFTMVKIKEINL